MASQKKSSGRSEAGTPEKLRSGNRIEIEPAGAPANSPPNAPPAGGGTLSPASAGSTPPPGKCQPGM